MTTAYNKIYLDDAMDCMGEALDYVSNACQMDTSIFFDMFLNSDYSVRFEDGDPSVVAGLSGSELVCKVMCDCGLNIAFPPAVVDYETLSFEYCFGEMIAFIQWYCSRRFSELLDKISMESTEEYVTRFATADYAEREAIAGEVLKGIEEPVRIQTFRKRFGLSQRQLSEAANVNIRTLQQYEIKSKDINKAAASTVMELARTMGCTPEDLMEFEHE